MRASNIALAALLVAASTLPALSQSSSESSSPSSSQSSSSSSSSSSSESSSSSSSSEPSSSSSSSSMQQGGGGGGSGGTSFEIDTTINITITVEQSVEIRRLILEVNPTVVQVVDFEIRLGAIVPTSIPLLPLPLSILAFLPALDGYLFFVLADGRIVVCHPETLAIVLILYA